MGAAAPATTPPVAQGPRQGQATTPAHTQSLVEHRALRRERLAPRPRARIGLDHSSRDYEQIARRDSPTGGTACEGVDLRPCGRPALLGAVGAALAAARARKKDTPELGDPYEALYPGRHERRAALRRRDGSGVR
jgi:hypothetical protein